MRPFPDCRTRPGRADRSPFVSHICMMLLALAAVASALGGSARAQTEPWKTEPSPLCSRDSALEMIRGQIDAAKNFDDPARRIAVLIRAADLLWPYQQERARAAFTEAFDVAARDFKEKGDEPKRGGRALLVETPDQRYIVIRAIARRDPAWAKQLTAEMLKKDREEADEATAKNPRTDVRTAWKLLDSATALLSSDPDAANAFATASLSYPASIRLTAFMYKLAEVNQRAADQFYAQALAAYGDKPLREFLYLAAYPFGLDNSGDMPWSGPYVVPAAFAPDLSLKRLFVQTLLRRARQTLETPPDEGDNYNGFPASGHILQVLTRVEPQVQRFLPGLSGAAEQARNNLLSSLSSERQGLFLQPQRDQESPRTTTFDERMAAAEAEPNMSRRDELLVTAILNAGPAESLDRVVKAADKISDSSVRPQLLDWFYFNRAQRAIKDKRLDEATKLASKVQETDQRAYLYSEIAKESLQTIETRIQAQALLDEIVTTANKAPDTVVTARALLAAAYLYLKLDPGRSIAVFGEAVKSINRMESPDFSKQSLIRKIEGQNFARYASFSTPGFDPESAFREMAKVDFDNALSLTNGLADKSLRAQTTLVLTDFCLQRAEQQEKVRKASKKVKP